MIREQTRIVADVAWLLSVVEELEAGLSANLRRPVRLRQSILQPLLEARCRSELGHILQR